MNYLLEALLSQMDGEDFDTPIIIMPSSMLKKKKMEDNVEEGLGTRLGKVEKVPTTVMPVPTPG